MVIAPLERANFMASVDAQVASRGCADVSSQKGSAINGCLCVWFKASSSKTSDQSSNAAVQPDEECKHCEDKCVCVYIYVYMYKYISLESCKT